MAQKEGKRAMKTVIRSVAALVAAAFTLALAGCGPKVVRGTGGSALPLPEKEHDFTAAWITARTDLFWEDESWRIGTMGGRSVKITAGEPGVGVWISNELPSRYMLHVTVSFDNLPEEEARAEVRLGPDQSRDSLAFVVQRDADGRAALSLESGGESLCATGPQKTKDTAFSAVLECTGDDGRLQLYVTGNHELQYCVETDPLDGSVLDSLKTVSFYSSRKDVVFSDLAVDTMIYRPGDMIEYARAAFHDLQDNFAVGTEESGQYFPCGVALWGHGMAILGMETMAEAGGEEGIAAMKKNFQAQWENIQEAYTEEGVTAPGKSCNPACDDAAWTAMTLMCIYRTIGDERALDLAAAMIRNAYDYWQDGSTENGLWYRYGEDGSPREYNWSKSVYCAGLLLSALQYHEITKGTERNDSDLYQRTLALYDWVEANLRRDDNLYYCDYGDNRDTGEKAPLGHDSPDHITYENGSVSSLFGNTGMAAINAQLYRMTGEEKYRDRALSTANALAVTPYNNKGVLVNDRDGWTDAAFMRFFVKDVLTMEGIDPAVIGMVKNTALSIVRHCRTEEGFYYPRWSGGLQPVSGVNTPLAHQLPTTATTTHMIFAAALAETMGLFQE